VNCAQVAARVAAWRDTREDHGPLRQVAAAWFAEFAGQFAAEGIAAGRLAELAGLVGVTAEELT
jgi:hypothetical protein